MMNPEQLKQAKRDEALLKWQDASTALENAKVAETQARQEVVKLMFDGKPAPEGTNNFELGNGYVLKIVGKINYNLSESAKPKTPGMVPWATRTALNELEKTGNEGKFIAERLVKWSPELSLTEYRALAPQYKAIIDKALTTSDGMPSVSIEAPKGSK